MFIEDLNFTCYNCTEPNDRLTHNVMQFDSSDYFKMRFPSFIQLHFYVSQINHNKCFNVKLKKIRFRNDKIKSPES